MKPWHKIADSSNRDDDIESHQSGEQVGRVISAAGFYKSACAGRVIATTLYHATSDSA